MKVFLIAIFIMWDGNMTLVNLSEFDSKAKCESVLSVNQPNQSKDYKKAYSTCMSKSEIKGLLDAS